MTNKAQLLALAERCGTATGADRELDVRLALEAKLIRGGDGHGYFYGAGNNEDFVLERGYYDHAGNAAELPYFTASLDAALTLVPEGWLVHYLSQYMQGTWNAVLRGPVVNGRRLFAYARGKDAPAFATPALAICAAALKARAALSETRP